MTMHNYVYPQGPCFDDSMGLQCDSDGNFLTVQCSDDTCWCVYPENGTEIPNTRVGHHRAGTLPDCFDQGKDIQRSLVVSL